MTLFDSSTSRGRQIRNRIALSLSGRQHASEDGSPTVGRQKSRFWMRKMSAYALASAWVLVGVGCESSGSITSFPLAPGAPLKIGYLTSLTGSCAGFSQASLRGAKRMVNTIDQRGGVLGHPLRLLIRDDRGRPSVGVEQARDLVLGAEVKYLAGTCGSAVATRVARLVANPFHMLYVPGVADPRAFAAGPSSYVFDLPPTVNGGAFEDGSNQVQIIARAIEDANSTDPSAVRKALAAFSAHSPSRENLGFRAKNLGFRAELR